MSLRARLGVAGGVVLAVLVVVAVALPRQIWSAQLSQVDHRLGELAPVAVAAVTAGLPQLAPGQQPLPPGGGLSDVYVTHVVEGRRADVSDPAGVHGRLPRLPNARPAASLSARPLTVASTAGGGSWRALWFALPDGSSLLLAIPLNQADGAARATTVAVGVAGLVVLAAMLAAGWWLLVLGLRPIAEVTMVADAISSGQRGRRVQSGPPRTEAGRLGRAFNVMLADHELSEERLRRFVADASHELRSPLTAIAGMADLWRQGSLPVTEIDDVMRRVGRETGRMKELVDELLLLASLDNGPRPIGERVDLSAIAVEVVDDLAASFPSRTVTLDAPAPAAVDGDRLQLGRLVANLLNNALVHTDPPAAVSVQVTRSVECVSVVVADQGAGLSPTEVERAFERFWRGERSTGRPGSGLGLALVAAIADAHRGKVTMSSSPGAGTTVRVVLPASHV